MPNADVTAETSSFRKVRQDRQPIMRSVSVGSDERIKQQNGCMHVPVCGKETKDGG